MARGSQFRRAPIRVPSRRLTTWAGIQSTTFSGIAASSKALLAGFAASQINQRTTLIRVRGIMAIRSDQSAALENSMGSFGIAVVTDQAFSTGVTALPGPSTDIEGDYWQTWQALIAPPVKGAIASGSPGPSVHYMDIDSKGQRKIADLEAIALMVENDSGSGFEIAFKLRLLFLLS